MDIAGDGALPVGATHHLQPPEAGTAPPADSSVDVVVPWLLEQVAKLGMHAWPLLEDGWCPDPSSADYRFNHRELLRIWGVHLTTRTNVGDIRQRYRMTARLLHPDKLAKYSLEVQQWGTHIMTQLNLAREEIEMRIDWVKRRVIPPPVTSDSYPFQEVPEAVQLFLRKSCQAHLVVANSSESLYYNSGIPGLLRWIARLRSLNSFYVRGRRA